MFCCPSCMHLLDFFKENIFGCPHCDDLFKMISGNLKQIKGSYREEKRKLEGGIKKGG